MVRPLQGHVIAGSCNGFLGDRNQALPLVLGGPDGENAFAPVDIAELEPQDLADTGAAIFQKPDDCTVSILGGRETCEKAVDLLGRKNLLKRSVVAD